jgi:hypothetical protein
MLAVALYVLPTLAALLYLVWMVLFHSANSAFAGVWLVLLTLPWSHLSVLLLDVLHVDSIVLNLCLLTTFAVINAVIIYWSIARGERLVNR